MNVKKALFASSLFLCGVGVLPVTAGLPVAHDESEISSPMPEQQKKKRTITGNVTDGFTGEPLIGVSIMLKGSSDGTTTDLDGNFSLSIPVKAQLEFSYIGYKKQVLDVTDLVVANVKLESDNEMLAEVVVVGAGTQKKVSVTGAITSVKGTELHAPSSSLTSNFAGKLAGVIAVATDGEPGTSSNFYIRGIGTFGGRATPLILLDGVEISSGDLNRIPPESIESFSILKDASATAIYGARGANGVMLVTTKIGTENTKASINVTVENSFLKPVNEVGYVDGARWMEIYNEAQLARTPNATPKYSQERIDYTRSGINPYVYPDVDWYDLVFKESTMNQRANVNIMGGGPKVSYYMSLQANHDTGLLDIPKAYSFDNNINKWGYTFQNNIAYKVTPTTRIDLRMNAQIGNNKGPNASVSDIFYQVYNNNPVTFPAYFPAEPGDKHIKYGNAILSGTSLYTNPYQYMLGSYKEVNYSMLNTSIYINQNLDFVTKGLKIIALVNWKSWSETSYIRWLDPYWYRADSKSWSPDNPGEYTLERLNSSGSEYISQSGIGRGADNTFYFHGQLNYENTFGEDHGVTAMLMYMQREYRNDVLPNRNQGLSGRLTYAFQQKYLAEFNFGYNGTERLDKGKRFEFFPAMSLGWVVSSEKFWQPIEKYVDYFKLRGSYGLVGSDETGSYDGAAHFLYVNNVNLGGGGSYSTGPTYSSIYKKGPSINSYAVQNAHWERVKKMDIGVDMKLFNQVDVTFDYFCDKRDRILMRRASWPALLGYVSATPWSNIGKVENKGIELGVNWKKEVFKGFHVDFRGNFTYTENKYIDKDEPAYPYVWQTETGKPLSRTTGYIAEGLFRSQEEIDDSPAQDGIGSAKLMPGDIKYQDANGDGKITADDRILAGSSDPKFTFGLNLNAAYKGFDLSMLFTGAAGVHRLINQEVTGYFGGDDSHPATVWLDAWTPENKDATMPRVAYMTTSPSLSSNTMSTFWVQNSSYLRMKNLQFGYTLPKTVLKSVGIENVRFYYSVENLFTIHNMLVNVDPEIGDERGSSFPLTQTHAFGVNVTF